MVWAARLHAGMVIDVIDEVKNANASSDVNNSIEDVNDFLVTASSARCCNSLELSSAEFADRDFKLLSGKTRTVTFPQGRESSRRVASQCTASFPLVGCLGETCTDYSRNFSCRSRRRSKRCTNFFHCLLLFFRLLALRLYLSLSDSDSYPLVSLFSSLYTHTHSHIHMTTNVHETYSSEFVFPSTDKTGTGRSSD